MSSMYILCYLIGEAEIADDDVVYVYVYVFQSMILSSFFIMRSKYPQEQQVLRMASAATSVP